MPFKRAGLALLSDRIQPNTDAPRVALAKFRQIVYTWKHQPWFCAVIANQFSVRNWQLSPWCRDGRPGLPQGRQGPKLQGFAPGTTLGKVSPGSVR